MPSISRFLLALAVAAAWPSVSAGQPARKVSAPNVTVELVAAQPSLRPGENWLGLRFILEPGWHVYWVNPGDSGGPPTALWQPDAGLAPGEFEWPAPTRIAYGPLVNYGYYGDVVLPFNLEVAPDAATPSKLGANVSWLVCKDVCIGGKGRLAIAFPLAGDAAAAVPAWREMIEQSRARVPRPAPASWRVTVQDGGDAFLVTVTTGRREAGGTFFPMDGGVLDEPAPQHPEPADRGLTLRLKKSDLLTTVPASLRGVLTLDSGASHVVTLPLGAVSRKGR